MAMDSTSQMTVYLHPSTKYVFSLNSTVPLWMSSAQFFCIPVAKCLCPFPDILLYYRSSCIFLHWLLCTIHFLGCMLCFVSDGFWFVRQLTATSATKTVAIAATQVCGFLKFNTFLILLPASASPNATGANEYGCRSIAKASKDALYPF